MSSVQSDAVPLQVVKRRSPFASFASSYQLHLFMLLPIAWLIIFRYVPMYGAQIAFKDFRAGAGIVSDSVPDRELEETRAKARGMLRALAGDAA